MDRFLSIEAFVRVAETRSFAEAARQLGVTNSVVTHRVQQLERFIEAPLFHRSTRHVRLSEVGETYYKQCAHAVGMLSDLTDQMRGLRATRRASCASACCRAMRCTTSPSRWRGSAHSTPTSSSTWWWTTAWSTRSRKGSTWCSRSFRRSTIR